MNSDKTLGLLFDELDQSMWENRKINSKNILLKDNIVNSDSESNSDIEKMHEMLSSPFTPLCFPTSNEFNDNMMKQTFPSEPSSFDGNSIENHNIHYSTTEGLLSGKTYINTNHSNYHENNRSPNSLKIKEMLEDNNNFKESLYLPKMRDNKELNNNNSNSKPVHLPTSFSMESTKPLLSYPQTTTNETFHIITDFNKNKSCGNKSETESESDSDINRSPQVICSPSKIPLTNTVTINHFISKDLQKIDSTESKEEATIGDNIPSTRFSSDSSYNNDRVELSTTVIDDHFNLLKQDDSDKKGGNDDKVTQLFNKRLFSVATSVGDYKSAREDELKSHTKSLHSHSENGEELDLIHELDIATGIEEDDNDGNRNDKAKLDNILSLQNISLLEEHINAGAHTFLENIHLDTTDISSKEKKPLITKTDSPLRTDEKQIRINNDTIQTGVHQSKTSNVEMPSLLPEIERVFDQDEEDEGKVLPKMSSNLEERTTHEENGNEQAILFYVDDISNLDFSSNDGVSCNKESNLSSLAVPKNEKLPLFDESCTSDISQTEENSGLQGLVNKDRHENTDSPEELEQPCNSSSSSEIESDSPGVPENVIVLSVDAEKKVSSEPVVRTAYKETKLSNEDVEGSDLSSVITEEANIHMNSPLLPLLPNMESLFVDDLFTEDPDITDDSIEQRDLDKSNGFLSIWHKQELQLPCAPVQKKVEPLHVNTRTSSKLEKMHYSFKPKFVHNPKINYLEKQNYNNVPISLSQEFNTLLTKLVSESSTESETQANESFKIWSTDESNECPKSMAVVDVFGDDVDSSIIKSQSYNATVNKPVSIKSFQVDIDYTDGTNDDEEDVDEMNKIVTTGTNVLIKDKTPDVKNINIISPGKEEISDILKEKSLGIEKHNPPTVVKKNFPTLKTLNVTGCEEDKKNDVNLNVASEIETKVMLPDSQKEINFETHVFHRLTENTENIVDKKVEAPKPLDKGMLYINLGKVVVNLTGVKQHRAVFCIDIDNGIDTVQTDWKSLNDENNLLLDNELEIPIVSDSQKIFITLKCKYERPQNELIEVVEKVKVGKSFAGLGKNKYRFEKRYAQQKLKHDDWDYLFATDGSYGRVELPFSDEFLSMAENNVNKNIRSSMVNQWARISTVRNRQTKNLKDIPRRNPFNSAYVKYNAYFAKRTSNMERFPKSLRLALDMAAKYKMQQSMRKEGPLLQDGGDLDGLIENRYFELEGNTLTGYSEITKSPKIKINLLNVKDIMSNHDGANNERNFSNAFFFGDCFQLVFGNDECITFSSQVSKEDTREWYLMLKNVIDLNITHQPWIKKLSQSIR